MNEKASRLLTGHSLGKVEVNEVQVQVFDDEI